MDIQLEPHPPSLHHRELVRHEQTGPAEHRCSAHVTTAVHQRRVQILSDHLRAYRRPAAGVEEHAKLGSKRDLIRAVDLHNVRAIGCKTPQDIEIAMSVPQNLVDVPGSVRIAARTRDAAGLLLRGPGAYASRRCVDLV